LVRRNIFVNLYEIQSDQKVAIGFKALNQFNEKLPGKSKHDVNNFDIFIDYIGR
jgi:hypothetical protein